MSNLEDLKKPLPSEAISPHPTKPYLSSIKAIYVTERFNDVFGIGKWSVDVETESVDTKSGMVVVKTTFKVETNRSKQKNKPIITNLLFLTKISTKYLNF